MSLIPVRRLTSFADTRACLSDKLQQEIKDRIKFQIWICCKKIKGGILQRRGAVWKQVKWSRLEIRFVQILKGRACRCKREYSPTCAEILMPITSRVRPLQPVVVCAWFLSSSPPPPWSQPRCSSQPGAPRVWGASWCHNYLTQRGLLLLLVISSHQNWLVWVPPLIPFNV